MTTLNLLPFTMFAAFAASCSDTPTKPSQTAAIETAAPIATTAQLGATNAVLADASSRLGASVQAAEGRARLQGQLHALAERLNAGDATAARRHLAHARAELARQAQLDPDGAADRDAISLALDEAERLLVAPPSSRPITAR